MPELALRLAALMQRLCGGAAAPVHALQRLSGGANMESWAFEWAGEGYVLRRAPSLQMLADQAFSHAVEARLVQAARSAGVRAPEAVGVLEEADALGSGYVMRRVVAEVAPAVILAAPPPGLIDDIARELVRIHAIAPRPDVPLPFMDTATALAGLKQQFMAYGGDRPVLALALRWCEDHLPAAVPPCLVHGDFRMGNLMVGPAGLAAVLDWELAHWGDAHEDLAYGCMTAWRFGHVENEAYGCAPLDTFIAAYEAAGGGTVERTRFRFWRVYRTLWWALGCLRMGERWRSGADRSLERVVIARRCSENELDLLLLLEADAPAQEREPIAAPQATTAVNQGEPSAFEMLQALREWVAQDVKPHAQGRDKFMAAVAINALGMLQREAQHPVAFHDKALCEALLAGRQGLATPGLLSRLRTTALAKLDNDGPKYAALQQARQRWIT